MAEGRGKELVEKYYEKVRDHLRKLGLWKPIEERLGAEAVVDAVRELLNAMKRVGMSPEMFEWERAFEKLAEAPSVRDFVKKVLEALRRPPPPPPKLLPPVPETCPIDGTRLAKVDQVPIPSPDGTIKPVSVPATIEIYKCEYGHLFERDLTTGILIERTSAYLAQKLYKEWVREERAVRGS